MSRVNNIVIGAGSFGAEVTRFLCDKGENVIVIDKDKKVFEELKDYSFLMEEADALDVTVLEKYDSRTVKSVIITTNDDNANIYLADLCRTVLGYDHVYLRLKDARKKKLITSSNTYCICPFVLSIADFADNYY